MNWTRALIFVVLALSMGCQSPNLSVRERLEKAQAEGARYEITEATLTADGETLIEQGEVGWVGHLHVRKRGDPEFQRRVGYLQLAPGQSTTFFSSGGEGIRVRRAKDGREISRVQYANGREISRVDYSD